MIDPILDLIATGTRAEQVSALDALLNLPLTEADVGRLAETLDRVLSVDVDPAVARKAAEIPIPAVQRRLREIATGHDDAARAAQIGLGTTGDPTVAVSLVEEYSQSGDLEVLTAIAALPPGSVPRNSRPLRAAAKSGQRDVQFWAAVALAKAGKAKYLRRMMKSLADDEDEDAPVLFWGSPWAAWDGIAVAAPVPETVHEYLAAELEGGTLDRNQWLTAGALTGLVDAEGSWVD